MKERAGHRGGRSNGGDILRGSELMHNREEVKWDDGLHLIQTMILIFHHYNYDMLRIVP